ncbi:MAG: glycosyltransferase [Lachnospiraceae bacterium]|nr:glycosyltransferase [Lachnospiraceae bacterium]
MRICHISTGYPISFQGGITNYVRSIAESQVRDGNVVYVVSSEETDKYAFSTYKYLSNKISPFRLQALKDKKGLERIQKFLDDYQFDIIHIHMIMDIDWDLYDIVKKYKYIVSLHDYFMLCPRIQMLQANGTLCDRYDVNKCRKCISWFNQYRIFSSLENRIRVKNKGFSFPKVSQKMTDMRYLKYKHLLENADCLLPVSYRVEEIFKNSGISGTYKVLHIGNISADRYKKEFHFDDTTNRKIKVVMLGSLAKIKGAELLIEFADRFDRQKFSFHFWGRPNEYESELIKHGIINHGAYQQTDLEAILEDADLGLVLSIWEDNGPQVVMEFLNNNVPVIGTEMGGIPDFIKHGVNGFLFNPYENESKEELCKKVNQLTISDIYKIKKNIRPTLTTVEHYSELKKIYEEVIK